MKTKVVLILLSMQSVIYSMDPICEQKVEHANTRVDQRSLIHVSVSRQRGIKKLPVSKYTNQDDEKIIENVLWENIDLEMKITSLAAHLLSSYYFLTISVLLNGFLLYKTYMH